MEIRINAIDAVNALYGVSSYHMADGNGNVKWKDGHETTAEETTAINAKIIELEAEYAAQAYARDRITAYPSTGDQLDYIYHNGVAKWKTDMIDPVKTKYPKG
jgi:hypothetical protein